MAMTADALYYPYIHFNDVNWLKATLLMFPKIKRMAPLRHSPFDAPEVAPYSTYVSRTHGSLIDFARIDDSPVKKEQRKLAKLLEADDSDPAFRRKFGKSGTRKNLRPNSLGFQLHPMKLERTLQDTLENSKLWWKPKFNEQYDPRCEYYEVHKRVGEAIMSTIAVACAYNEGLDIVGDARSGRLHKTLIEKDSDAIYDACLHPGRDAAIKPRPATGPELFEFILLMRCDLSKITPQRLDVLADKREALQRLLKRLRERASEIPTMTPGPLRHERFHDEVSSIFREWESDSANLSNFWRQFRGKGLADSSSKSMEKALDRIISLATGGVAGGAIGAQVASQTPMTAAGMGHAGLIAASGSLAVGLVAHAGTSVVRTRQKERNSPYCYLTAMKHAGVLFRGSVS